MTQANPDGIYETSDSGELWKIVSYRQIRLLRGPSSDPDDPIFRQVMNDYGSIVGHHYNGSALKQAPAYTTEDSLRAGISLCLHP